MPDTTPPLATITPSAVRRGVAVGLLLCLGGVLIWMAFNGTDAAMPLRLGLAGVGIATLAVADVVRRVTAVTLILTADTLADDQGRILCRTQDIARVENGAFAFKPSNGFALRLTKPAPWGWAPGLWWRFGRRIGVGGVVSKAETKVMADAITQRWAQVSEGRIAK